MERYHGSRQRILCLHYGQCSQYGFIHWRTNDLARRVYEHKNGLGSAFVKKYNVHKLVYYEGGDNIHSAIAREKQIKGGSRQKKIDLIYSLNPKWKDLFDEIS